ncbi:uncharacterized protein SPSK_00798 [Sporothrix schenckii 1099-18]|uniref:Uncharacterized protein n=1 Tax=Sporothrix schenckii 1099-18 TaxID=1397361 RepID=A0A0F2M0P2_SPOSC|nr:uncharacterized protein SPSK_00798 [Sporothrix schenckii 1099-18]KJR81721.1 hypothetical protein SPSK_00798 [Sporothrix schenckii 1099-18]
MGVFFVSWALWEEMTFVCPTARSTTQRLKGIYVSIDRLANPSRQVLACAIAVVFLIGLFKLWRTSRQVRRQEIIDEEKRARLTEMRKVGMSSSPTARSAAAARKQRTNSDIPFGIRAIQTGVEVDGIWISRPTTPSRSSSKTKAPGQTGRSSGQQTGLDTPSNASTPLPQISEDDTTLSTHLLTVAPSSPTRNTRPVVASGPLNEEALRRLEGAYSHKSAHRSVPTSPAGTAAAAPLSTTAAPQLNTYIPSSRMSSPSPSSSINRHHGPTPAAAVGRLANYQLPPPPASQQQQQQQQQHLQHTSTASADSLSSMSVGAAGGSGPSSHADRSIRSNRSNRSNRSTSSRSSTSSASRYPVIATLPADKSYYHRVAAQDTTGHFRTSEAAAAAAYTPMLIAAPGTALANRPARKVNAAVEVLPAGTFGPTVTPYTDEDREANETMLDGRHRLVRDSGRASQSTSSWA